jgi:hypothetical protein
MSNLTPEGLRLVSDVAQRHGFSTDAVMSMLNSVSLGGGSQAQFNHPEFGGMGQWSQGGMIMIGDMFNNNLKYRVDGLCNELSNLLRNQPLWQPAPQSFQAQSQGGGVSLFVAGGGSGASWWPSDLGQPSSTGAQNDLRYAYFPATRRLALNIGGQVRVYDAGDHMISGFSQQQGGDQSLTFSSQYGLVRVADLPLVSPAPTHAAQDQAPAQVFEPAPTSPVFLAPPPPATAQSFAPSPVAAAAPAPAPQDIFATIERLAELRKKEILTEDEFAAKKAELLSRI